MYLQGRRVPSIKSDDDVIQSRNRLCEWSIMSHSQKHTDGDIGAVSAQVIVCNQKGLHARAAARFVKRTECFDANVSVRKLGVGDTTNDPSEYTTVCAASILGLLLLAAENGATLEISATGRQAEEAVQALAQLVERRFGEDE